MTIQKGYDSIIGFNIFTGTTVANTLASEFLFADNLSFARDQVVQQVDELGTTSRGMRRMEFGDVTANGSIAKSVDPNNGIGLYQFLLAGSVTSASITSGTFSHIFSEGDEVLDSGGKVIRLLAEVSPGGQSSTTRIWGNGVVDTYALSAAPGGLPKETWSFRYSDHTAVTNSMSTATLTQTPPIQYSKVSVKLGATISAVSLTCVQDISLNVNNNIIENRELCNTTTVENFDYGKRDITGSFNLVFEDYTHYNNFVNNTSTAISLLLESSEATSGTNHSIQLDLPECFYQGAHPTVDGPSSIIMQPINFVANYGSNAGYQIKVTVINSQSSAPLTV